MERYNDQMQRELGTLNQKMNELLEQVNFLNGKADSLTTFIQEKESCCSCKNTTRYSICVFVVNVFFQPDKRINELKAPFLPDIMEENLNFSFLHKE